MIQMETLEIIRQIKNIEKEAEERVSEWENKNSIVCSWNTDKWI